MFGRIKDLLAESGLSRAARSAGEDADFHFAVAVLLVEAARMDARIDSSERRTIAALLARRYGFEVAEAGALVARAEVEAERSSQLFGFTHRVNGRLSQEERIGLIEMLWEVAYADGALHHYEANLMRRLAGLLHVPDADSGAARQRVLARLQSEGEGTPGRASN